MSLTTTGAIPFPYQVQPGPELQEEADGTIQGEFSVHAEAENLLFLPQIGDQHPYDRRVEITKRRIAWPTSHRLACSFECFGIKDDPTDKITSYIGSPDRDVLQSHPDFLETIGGTPAAPKNGALFDPGTGDFQGFSSDSDLAGVKFYLRATTQVTRTYWTTKTPRLKDRMRIVPRLKGFNKPTDVEDFLILDTPYRQVGNHYQMSEIALGSGPGGWSPLIYPNT